MTKEYKTTRQIDERCGECQRIYLVELGQSKDLDKFACRLAPPITHFIVAPNSMGRLEIQQHTGHVPVLKTMLSCRFFRKRDGSIFDGPGLEPALDTPKESPFKLKPLY